MVDWALADIGSGATAGVAAGMLGAATDETRAELVDGATAGVNEDGILGIEKAGIWPLFHGRVGVLGPI